MATSADMTDLEVIQDDSNPLQWHAGAKKALSEPLCQFIIKIISKLCGGDERFNNLLKLTGLRRACRMEIPLPTTSWQGFSVIRVSPKPASGTPCGFFTYKGRSDAQQLVPGPASCPSLQGTSTG